MDNPQDNKSNQTNTGGGAHISKDVTVGGDFAGRDSISSTHYHFHQPFYRLPTFNNMAISTTKTAIHDLSVQMPLPSQFVHAQPPELAWTNREQERQILTDLYENGITRITGLIGLGGIGKSSLVRRWFDEFPKQRIEPDGFFWWSFYYEPSLDKFLESLLLYLTDGRFEPMKTPSPWARIQQLITLLSMGRFVIVLDGLEVMQKSEVDGSQFGQLVDHIFRNLLQLCAEPSVHCSFIVITSRYPLTDIQLFSGTSYYPLVVDYFSEDDGARYLLERGVKGRWQDLRQLSNEYGGHALSLALVAGYLTEYFEGDIQHTNVIPPLATKEDTKVNQILQAYDSKMNVFQQAFMQFLSVHRRPLLIETLEYIIHKPEQHKSNWILERLALLNALDLRIMLDRLEKQALINRDSYTTKLCYTTHPIVREYFNHKLKADIELHRKINLQLREFALAKPLPEVPAKIDDFNSVIDSIYYGCEAGLYDEAAQIIYENHLVFDFWNIGYLFGAYEFQLSLLREFFRYRRFTEELLVTHNRSIAFLITVVGQSYFELGQFNECVEFWERSLAVHSNLDFKTKAVIGGLLSQAKCSLGQIDDAVSLAIESLKFAKLADNKHWEGNITATLGWLAFLSGEIDSAEHYYREATKLKQITNPSEGLFSELGVQYATFLLATGNTNQSLDEVTQNLKKCQNRGWQSSILYCHRVLGDVMYITGKYDEAIHHYTTALELAHNFGAQEQVVLVILGVARVQIVRNEYKDATENLIAISVLCHDFEYILSQIEISNCWALLHLAQEQFSKAEEHAQNALKLAEHTNYIKGKADTLHILGALAMQLGNNKIAKDFLSTALALRKKIHDPNVAQTRNALDKLETMPRNPF